MDLASEERHVKTLDGSSLARHEALVTRLAWAVCLVTIMLLSLPVAFVMALPASEPRYYMVGLVALPVLFSLLMSALIRHWHVTLLRRYQAHLIMQAVELQQRAARDELTQLHNRRYFYERLQEAIGQARAGKQTLALLLIDVDDLKAINDNYGHLMGDVALKKLAEVLTEHVRGGDVVARLGGDEFGIVMPETDKRGAYALARRLWQSLEDIYIQGDDGASFRLNVSIGVSGYSWGGEDADEMLHWADTDMYANKVSRKLPTAFLAEGTLSDIDAAPSDPFLGR